MNLTRLGGALLAVGLPFAVPAVPAFAGAAPDTALTLTIALPDGPAKTVELECDPAGGTHPNAKDACAELVAAQGDFAALQAQQAPAACTMEYQPVSAAAKGRWQGNPVNWKQEFSNGCTLRTGLGPVFQF